MTTDTDKASDKLVEMALKAAFEKGWCAAAQWAQRDDLRHDTGSIAYAGQRDAILAGKAAEVRAAIIADLCGDVEPVALMFQHNATGRIAFVDTWQKNNGWATANPRYKEVGALHGASTVAALKSRADALQARVDAMNTQATREPVGLPAFTPLNPIQDVYEKLHAGRLGAHWLWVVIEQIAAGIPESDAMREFGYYAQSNKAADIAASTAKGNAS